MNVYEVDVEETRVVTYRVLAENVVGAIEMAEYYPDRCTKIEDDIVAAEVCSGPVIMDHVRLVERGKVDHDTSSGMCET